MSLLTCTDVSFSHLSTPLLEEVSFTLAPRERVGLVGLNGCGKSTLLALLAGDLQPSGGTIALRRGARVARVRQFLPDALRELSALDVRMTPIGPRRS